MFHARPNERSVALKAILITWPLISMKQSFSQQECQLWTLVRNAHNSFEVRNCQNCFILNFAFFALRFPSLCKAILGVMEGKAFCSHNLVEFLISEMVRDSSNCNWT